MHKMNNTYSNLYQRRKQNPLWTGLSNIKRDQEEIKDDKWTKEEYCVINVERNTLREKKLTTSQHVIDFDSILILLLLNEEVKNQEKAH